MNSVARSEMYSVELWYVAGIDGVYYHTKTHAEAEARKAFPDENANTRYSRVRYKTFYKEGV